MGVLRVRAESYGTEATELRADTREFEGAERVARALRLAIPLALGAVLSLPIPVWHLFGVPGFLAASVILGVRRLRQTRELQGLGGVCPACRAAQAFPVGAEARFPISLRCPGCGEFLQLNPVSGS